MGIYNLTEKEGARVFSFMHDLLIRGGVRDDYSKPFPRETMTFDEKSCANIAGELMNRKFANIDKDIESLVGCEYYLKTTNGAKLNIADKKDYIRTSESDPYEIAKLIVSFAIELGILWDAYQYLRLETDIEKFEKTYLGRAVKELGAYLHGDKRTDTAVPSTYLKDMLLYD